MTLQAAKFKYTFPIAKAERREDGTYLVGYASGPEVDTENERMSPEAIERFSSQINTADPSKRLAYRDAHAEDGVMRDLGEITKAWINDHFHLGIEVKLDTDNPAAAYLFKQIDEKGKQYGMSVAGTVTDYADEFVDSVGKSVRTYKNVVLDEISNTTRPAWYPSFGTVLSKSIKDASSDATSKGVTIVDNDELLDKGVEDTTKADGGKAAADVAATAAADAAAAADKATAEAAAATEKSGRKLSGVTTAELLGLYNTMGDTLRGLGVLEPAVIVEPASSEKSASAADDKTTEKTEADKATAESVTKSDLDAVASALTKANERIAELEARPATVVPGVITDDVKKAGDELADLLAKASPSDRLRLAFVAHTGGK